MPKTHSSQTETARELRRRQTPYEAALWRLLRDNRMENFHWRRQHPIGTYYADFACVRAKLVVELDGDSHADRQAYDAYRDAMLSQCGWRTLRIANRDLMRSPKGVWQMILQALGEAEEM